MKILSEASISALAGAATYQRGVDYYNQGLVSNLDINNGIIKAQVHGSSSYQVQLRHTAKIFEGSCNCPASDNFDFCKHCVAVALSYYYSTQQNQELDESPDADTLTHYLGTLTKPKLVDELDAIIKQDKQLRDLWTLRAELATGRLDTKELRKQITKALPFKPSGIWRFNQVARYFADAEQRIRALCGAISRLPATQAIKLLIYAYERLEKTLETVDDSGGYRFSLLEVLEYELENKFSANDVDSAERVDLMASFFINDKYHYELVRSNTKLAQALNQQEQVTLIKALTDHFNKLAAPDKQDVYKNTVYARLEKVLVEHAQSLADANMEIELLTKGAVTVSKCLQLVERCLDHKDLVEAKKWLSYASQFENLRVSDIAEIEHGQVKIWLAEGDYNSALEAQWAVFLEDESLSSILELIKTSEQINARHEWLEKCISYIKSRLSDDQTNPRHIERCETLIAILLQEHRQQEAAALAANVKLKVGTLMAIVNHASTLGRDELSLAERACNYLIAFGNHDTNDRAINFLTKISNHFTNEKKAFAKLINSIYHRPENKRKINFTKELKQNFGGLIDSR